MSHLKKRKGITLPAVTNGTLISNSVGSLNTVTNGSNWNIQETPILFNKEEFSSLTKVQIRITSKNLVNLMEFIE